MKLRSALASSLLASVLLLAGCGDGGAGSNTQAPPVAAQAAPAGQSWTETVVRTPEGGFRMGNPDAPIKLVEYGARSCPACGAFSRGAAVPLEEQYVASGKVSFEFRDYLVHGQQDLAAALLGQCGGTAPFFPILNQMYASQQDWTGRLYTAAQNDPSLDQRLRSQSPQQALVTLAETMGLIDFVKQRGVPEPQARACLTNMEEITRIDAQTREATQSGRVTGTPTFYLNDQRLDGAISWPDVEAALKRAGA